MSRLLHRPGGAFALIVLALALIAAAVPEQWLPYDPRHGSAELRYRPPFFLEGADPQHPLGTDGTGRDQLSMLVAGSRTTLTIVIGAALIGFCLGVILGTIAAYVGGWRSSLIMRLADIQLSFPSIILLIVVVAAFGNSIFLLTLILGLSAWASYARIAFTSVLVLKEREFIEAARAVGLSTTRIMTRHLLPNMLPVLVIFATVNMSGLAITEASLSYIGVGVQPPTPDWGAMIRDAQSVLFTRGWASVLPGACVVLVVLALSILGDELRTVLVPSRG